MSAPESASVLSQHKHPADEASAVVEPPESGSDFDTQARQMQPARGPKSSVQHDRIGIPTSHPSPKPSAEARTRWAMLASLVAREEKPPKVQQKDVDMPPDSALERETIIERAWSERSSGSIEHHEETGHVKMPDFEEFIGANTYDQPFVPVASAERRMLPVENSPSTTSHSSDEHDQWMTEEEREYAERTARILREADEALAANPMSPESESSSSSVDHGEGFEIIGLRGSESILISAEDNRLDRRSHRNPQEDVDGLGKRIESDLVNNLGEESVVNTSERIVHGQQAIDATVEREKDPVPEMLQQVDIRRDEDQDESQMIQGVEKNVEDSKQGLNSAGSSIGGPLDKSPEHSEGYLTPGNGQQAFQQAHTGSDLRPVTGEKSIHISAPLDGDSKGGQTTPLESSPSAEGDLQAPFRPAKTSQQTRLPPKYAADDKLLQVEENLPQPVQLSDSMRSGEGTATRCQADRLRSNQLPPTSLIGMGEASQAPVNDRVAEQKPSNDARPATPANVKDVQNMTDDQEGQSGLSKSESTLNLNTNPERDAPSEHKRPFSAQRGIRQARPLQTSVSATRSPEQQPVQPYGSSHRQDTELEDLHDKETQNAGLNEDNQQTSAAPPIPAPQLEGYLEALKDQAQGFMGTPSNSPSFVEQMLQLLFKVAEDALPEIQRRLEQNN